MAISFLHAADLHLGRRTTLFEERACDRISEARFEAIENIRAKAAEHRVDFILLAGDIFDDHTVEKRIAERPFTLFEGKKMPCPVFIIPGNHDPLVPGGVWDRDPWTREQPTKQTYLLREAAPIRIPDQPVTLFPCPLRNRNSIEDPTSWMARHPRKPEDKTIHIGLAHGSLFIMPNLPEDDHLIRKDAAEYYGLDYLALGHWHKPLRYPCRDGAERTAYSGTHEPMRFPNVRPGLSTGGISFSSDGDAERFHDAGRGTAQLVTIDAPGTPPRIDTIDVGHLHWSAEMRDVTAQSIGDIISEFSTREGRTLTILNLYLSGVVDPEQHQRIETTLREVIENRYYPGSNLDADDVLIEPKSDHLNAIAGDGVLGRMLNKLREETQSSDSAVKRVADHALKMLYRIAWEEHSK